MRFKVPQNVQREDTIIGPLTLKQMGILGGGGGLAYAIFITLSKSYFIEVWLPPVLLIVLLTLAVAFLKVHSLPFHVFLMNVFEYNYLPKKRVWTQGNLIKANLYEEKKTATKTETANKPTPNIEAIAETLDSAGKKHALQSMINQNYK